MSSGVVVWRRRRDLWESLRVHRRAGWLVMLGAGLLAALFWVAEPPDEFATARLDAPVAEAAALLGRPDTRLDALSAVGLTRVFPGLLPGDPADRRIALARLDQAIAIRREGEHALTIDVHLADPRLAGALLRELLAPVVAPAAESAPVPARPARLDDLRAERARIDATLDAADNRAAAVSASMTDLARDMVGALRVADAKPPTADVVDEARKLLAELQLKRVELSSKYQDDFPAIGAVDGEIAKLRGFIDAEEHRATARRPAANPVFETLTAERRRLATELDGLDAQRAALRARQQSLQAAIDTAERQPAPPPPVAAPRAVAGPVQLVAEPDLRLVVVPAILALGVILALLTQFLLLRQRRVFATVAEVEAVLELPVLRCLDASGQAVEPAVANRVRALLLK